MAVCRSCGARIIFITTRQGKYMPCDPELVAFDDCDEGTLLVTHDGSTVNIGKYGYLSDPDNQVTEGYVSHFATCPHADKHRRPK